MKRLSANLCSFSLCIILAAPCARAQYMPLPTDVQPGAADANIKLPDFDVVSIRENKGESHMMRWMYTEDGIDITNLSLKNLIASAYNIKQYLISGGPSWVNSTGFDIRAKVAPEDVPIFKNLRATQRGIMLRKLLTERFHLAAHIDTKTLPVYDLVLAGGPKFKASAPDPAPSPDADPSDHPKPRGRVEMGPGMTRLDDMPLSALTNQLGYAVERTVIDKTGLTGKYDIDLKWTPAEQEGKADGITDNPAPDIFTALQEQLGLKLESSKGPVDTLVIDHVQMPSQN